MRFRPASGAARLYSRGMDRAVREAFAHAESLEREVLRRWPGAWQVLDELRDRPGLDWPRDWCLLPMAATATWLRDAGPVFPPPPVAAVHALYLWRFSRSVWRFNRHLMARLLDQVPDAAPDAGRLSGLPEWCVYVTDAHPEWPGSGLWIHLEHDFDTGRPELRLLLDPGGGLDDMTAVPVYLDRDTVTEALADYRATAIANAARPWQDVRGGELDASVADFADKVDAYVGIAGYLARPEADIRPVGRPGAEPVRPRRPVKGRREWMVGSGES